MNKVLDFSSSISNKWWLIGAVLLGATITGMAISSGQLRVIALLFLLVSLLVFVSISRRLKFWLLAFSIPLSLVQIPSSPIPYGFTVSEIILLALATDELLSERNDHGINGKPLNLEIVIPLGLFTIAALVTDLSNGGFSSWHVYCLMPILWFFLASRKIRNQKEAWLLVKLSLLTIIGFIVIVVWAVLTGHFEIYDPLHTGNIWRLGDGMLVTLGPIQFVVFAIRVGSIAALGFPACIMLWIANTNKGERWWRRGAPLILAGFCIILILTAARTALGASILGTLLVIMISGRFRSPKLLGAVALLFVVITLWGRAILNLFPEQNIPRLLSLLQGGVQGVQTDANFNVRTNALMLAWKFTIQNPLGVGFGYLGRTYRVDDAIMYAYILEGTGILGSIAFLMIVVQLALKFVLIILRSSVGFTRDFASLGLGTLVVGLVAGVSSQSILFEPAHAFVFWAIIMTTYHARRNREANRSSRPFRATGA